MDQLKVDRGVAKGRFTRKVNVTKERLARDDPPAVLKSLLAEVETAFSDLEVRHDAYYCELLSAKSEMAELKEAEIYILECERIKSELVSLIIKRCGDSESKMETLIKVKRLDPPEFSGDMRNYGTFKRDYMRLIVPFYGQDAYALKKCLSGEALTCVEGVEDEFEEMFRRLDDKYGNPCKLTEAIVSELKSLKPLNDGDSKRLVYMIKVVERAWLDMRKIGLESEMKTTSIVTLVERLPPTLKRNWVIKSQKVGNAKDLFENLLQFLLQERRVCEYLESDLRCSTSSKVVTNSASCDNTSENVKDDLDEMKLIQGQHSAMISECLTTVSRLAAQMSNNPDVKCPPKWCWYHGVDGHSIYDSYAFKSLSNYDKFAQLKRNNACYKCVNLGHFSKFCNVSGVSSCDVMVNGKKCGREHHKMLHSSI
ncbi:uncharacterized protein [Palaemon carinicauda]|uniref:uncharacterized protein n=1 Tax=Palaemon carinicauda TaxID=392227 RepID=UPI0035B63ADF